MLTVWAKPCVGFLVSTKLFSLTPYRSSGKLCKILNMLSKNGILEHGRPRANHRPQAKPPGRGSPMESRKPASGKLRRKRHK